MCYQKVLQALSEFCYCQHNVQMCDTDPQSNRRKPNNYVEVDNRDCVIMTQSFDTYDIHRVLCS